MIKIVNSNKDIMNYNELNAQKIKEIKNSINEKTTKRKWL